MWSGGATVALVGLAGDRALVRRLQAAIHSLIDLTGETSLEMLMGTLQAADLVISTDSGPAHLARALGTRVIALHGPTDAALHGPGDPACTALRVDLPCGPCYDFRHVATCQFGDTLCMEWLHPDRVVGTARFDAVRADRHEQFTRHEAEALRAVEFRVLGTRIHGVDVGHAAAWIDAWAQSGVRCAGRHG